MSGSSGSQKAHVLRSPGEKSVAPHTSSVPSKAECSNIPQPTGGSNSHSAAILFVSGSVLHGQEDDVNGEVARQCNQAYFLLAHPTLYCPAATGEHEHFQHVVLSVVGPLLLARLTFPLLISRRWTHRGKNSVHVRRTTNAVDAPPLTARMDGMTISDTASKS